MAKYEGKPFTIMAFPWCAALFAPRTCSTCAHFSKPKWRPALVPTAPLPCLHSNQFGGQEPGTNEEIKAFASDKGFSGVLMDKINVNGGDSSPVFKWLKVCALTCALTCPDMPSRSILASANMG